jgi:predicted ATPase/class 3 adenylate cyclase/predicted negative regulator of RcsB-dependent stress response
MDPVTEQRALLLTDVVDSTKLSERLGDQAMAAVWTAHDRAARDLLPVWRGREIDKTDGMLLMFDGAADAVGYALAYHQALQALPVPLKARAGLHVGPVILRENPAEDVARGAKPIEVEGLAKPTAARVMALARGGQTLLSAEARAALGEAPWPMQSHGHWQLKGLAEPVELFEIHHDDTAFATPPDADKAYRVVRAGDRWLPVREIPNNLPLQATSFVGRERERREVRELLFKVRLLNLLGMGGLGKTRLSLEVAADVMAEFPDGVWFLDLAPIRDPALVLSEAARVLGVREEADRPLLQTLCAALKGRRTLLIFDNCEHLIQASADLASAILRAAPLVRILASSREVLRVPGEHGYPVLPLPLPKRDDGIDALAQSTAVRLFVDRARAQKASFALTERDAPAVAELVVRLEGIPLALELAAARVRSLGIAEINARLKDRYKLLTGGGRVLLERQQTLRALVDWSYELLNDDEQRVFNRLAVFAGGFDLPAAERICGADPLQEEDVLDLLSSLVDKSLVMADEGADATRYRMLETLRDYACEKLEQSAEAPDTAVRHCDHYFAFAKAARDGLMEPDTADWVRRAEADLDNIRAAIALTLSGGADPILAVKFAVTMQPYWQLRGHATEGRGVVRAALALPAVQASELALAHANYAGAVLAEVQADHAEARRMLETSLGLHRKLGNEVEVALTLSTLSHARLEVGDAAGAEASEREALAMFRSLGHAEGEAIGLLHLGQFAVYVGDAAAAQAHLEGALRIAKDIDYHEVAGEAELRLAENAFDSGRLDDARQHLERSLAICTEAGDRHGAARATGWFGRIHLAAGDLASARKHLCDAAQTLLEFEMREELIECLEVQAELAGQLGQAELAARLAGAAQAYRSRLDLARSPKAAGRWERRLASLRQTLGPMTFDAAWNAGLALDFRAAIRQANTTLEMAAAT